MSRPATPRTWRREGSDDPRGAHGHLECLDPVTDLTRAAPFARTGKRTEAFVRSSTVAGNSARSQNVAPAAGPLRLKGGRRLTPDHAVMGAPSVLFDAVAVVPSADGAAELAGRKKACDFVDDAFAHQKFLGWAGDAEALLDAAGSPRTTAVRS